jgi:hypothetical protein
MRCHLAILLVAVCAVSGSAAPAPTDTLIANLLGPTPVLDDLRELTDSIGGRPTGSPAMDKAIDWAMARLKAAGADAVRAETYIAPRNWLPRTETAEITSPRYDAQPAERNQLRTAAMPFSPSTPAAGLEAEVIDVAHGDAKGFAKAKICSASISRRRRSSRTRRRSGPPASCGCRIGRTACSIATTRRSTRR